MRRNLTALWVLLGLVASAIWAGDDCSDNESEKIALAVASAMIAISGDHGIEIEPVDG